MTQPLKSKQDRIAWLLANQSLWEGIGVHERTRLWEIAKTMKALGLYSSKTMFCDIRLWNLICDARTQRRESQ